MRDFTKGQKNDNNTPKERKKTKSKKTMHDTYVKRKKNNNSQHLAEFFIAVSVHRDS
jgi:hypothetical protein